MEIAALGLRVDGVDGIDKASRTLDDLTKSAKGAEREVGELGSESSKAAPKIRSIGDESSGASSKVSALGSAAKAAGGVIVAAFSISKLAGYADAWSDLQSRVGAATGSMDGAAKQMDRLLKIANASYSPLEQTAEIYSRNVSTFKDLGKSAAEAADFTESLNNMLVLTATRGQRAESVQNALSKAMAVGKLQADGLETVLANGGEVAQALARELGTTVSGLREMASQGKITGDVIATSIVKSLDDVRVRAEEMPATLGDAFTRIGNNVTALVGKFDQVTGATSDLAAKIVELADDALKIGEKAIKAFAENIDTITKTVALATKLVAAYVVAVYAIPAAKAAASAATAAYTGVLRLFSAQVAMTTKQLLSMRTALSVVAAAFSAWEIGTYLRTEFEIVEKAGIALMSGLHTIAVRIASEFAIMGEHIKFALTNPFDFARGVIADFFGWIAGLGKSALKLIGFEDLAAGIDTEFKGIRGSVASEHDAMLKEMRATTQTEIAGIKDVYADMFASVGKDSEAAATKVEKVNKKTEELGKQLKNTGGAAGEIGKIDKAFADLMARLFPTQAAQAKYNQELAILAKHLRGGALARAVSELTKQFTGGDADGAAKAIKDYNKRLKELVDRLNPAAVAARTFREEQLLLLDAIKRTGDPTGELARSLATLEQQYKENNKATSEWAKWTESALDRVDSAFADAWRNIGDGFEGFRKNLTNAFKQMLAELAHMAITRPIVMQIGSMLGIGGGGAASGIGGMIGSAAGGSGGISWGQLASYGQSAYSALTGWGPAAMAGYQSGGLWGGAQAVGSYYGNMLGNAASTVGGWFGMGGAGAGAGAAGTGFGLGGSLVSGEVGSAAYAGAQAGAGSVGGAISSMAIPIAAAYAAFQAYGAYKDGVRLDPKDTRGNAASWVTGFQPLAEVNGLVSKITDKLGIGGALGNILNIPSTLTAMIGGALFGGKWQTKDGGLSLGVQGGDFAGQQYEYQKKKGGLFKSNKKRTRFSALDTETESILTEAYSSTETAVSDLYKQLGYTVEEATLSGLSIGATQISTMGKTSEQIGEAVTEWLGTVAEGINTELNKVFGTGLDYDLDGMRQFVGNLLSVNEVLRHLDVSMYDASVAGGKLAESLSAMAGGLDALAASSSVYYDNFFTAEEKAEDAIDSIARAFKDADVTLVGSREEYRKMVESIDLTSASGQEMFTKLMSLSGLAAQYFTIVEQQAAQAIAQAQAAAQQAVVGAMATANSAYSTLERSIAAERKRITTEFNAAAQAEQVAQQAASQAAASMAQAQAASLTASRDISKRLIDIFKQIDNAVKSALDRLMSTDTAVVAMRREQSLSIVRGALATARSGGSLAGIDGLTDAITTSSIIDSASYKTAVELQREQGRTANLISDLGELNGKQLSTEEKIYEKLSAQLEYARSISSSVSGGFSGVSASLQAKYDADMAALDAELEAAKLQMDALNGVDNSIMSVREAVDAMNAAVVAAIHQQNKFVLGDTSKTELGSSAATSSDAGLEATIKRMHLSTLGHEAEQETIQLWFDRIRSGASLTSLQDALSEAARKSAAAPKIPAFATGGFHSGGLRIVGENGPELEATGSSRIFNAAQTEQILSGSRSNDSTSAAITRLENTIAQQAEALRAIAKHTRKSAQNTEVLERWDFDGLPEERTA